jgi:hypothetical protein
MEILDAVRLNYCGLAEVHISSAIGLPSRCLTSEILTIARLYVSGIGANVINGKLIS